MKKSITIIPKLKVKWKGVFDLDELYKNIKSWLDYQGYGDEKSKFQEKRYVEKIKGDEKQLEILWLAQKNQGDYFAYVIKIEFRIIGLKEIEKDFEGRKIKSNKGDITLDISSELILDRKDRWKSSLMQNLYEKFLVRDRLENHKLDLYTKTYSLHDEIKEYLNMHKY